MNFVGTLSYLFGIVDWNTALRFARVADQLMLEIQRDFRGIAEALKTSIRDSTPFTPQISLGKITMRERLLFGLFRTGNIFLNTHSNCGPMGRDIGDEFQGMEGRALGIQGSINLKEIGSSVGTVATQEMMGSANALVAGANSIEQERQVLNKVINTVKRTRREIVIRNNLYIGAFLLFTACLIRMMTMPITEENSEP
ncbi:MAG: hypothetical protein HYT76_07670 [Deltaproteobacteria bacterium]|nr:hypothetical protein [Deltaproteobacteria bacterium]